MEKNDFFRMPVFFDGISMKKICLEGSFSLAFLLLLHLFPVAFVTHCPELLLKSAVFIALFLFMHTLGSLLKCETFSVPVKFILLLAGSFSFFALVHFVAWPSLSGDDAHYILEAQALRDGTVEELARRILHMSSYDTLHQWIVPQYPPIGFPYMLRAAMLFGVENPAHFCIVPIACFSILTAFWWMHYHEELKGNLIFLFLIFTVFHPGALDIAFRVLSDIPFVCMSGITLLLADTLYCRQSINGTKRVIPAGLMVLLCCFSILLRSGGLALYPCILIAQCLWLWRQKKQKSISAWCEIVMVLLLTLLLYLWQSKVFPSSNTSIFRSSLRNFSIERLFSNLSYYYRLGVRNSPFGRTFLSYLIFWIFSGCAIVSALRRFRSHAWMICWVLLNFIPLLLIDFCTERYLLPILPFYLIGAYDGAMFLWQKQNLLTVPAWKKIRIFLLYALSGIFALMMIFCCCNCTSFIYNEQLKKYVCPRPGDSPMAAEFQETLAFLDRRGAPSETIGCFSPRLFTLFSKQDYVYFKLPIPFGRCNHYCLRLRDLKAKKMTTANLLKSYPDYDVSFQNAGYIIFSRKTAK